MAIAANYRKHPEALALQMPLPFGRILKWATARPTTKLMRDIRTARGRVFAAAGRITYPAKSPRPQWVKDATRILNIWLTKAFVQMPLAISAPGNWD